MLNDSSKAKISTCSGHETPFKLPTRDGPTTQSLRQLIRLAHFTLQVYSYLRAFCSWKNHGLMHELSRHSKLVTTPGSIKSMEVLPRPCIFPRPAKSPSSLRQWLVSDGRRSPQCLLTLERHFGSSLTCVRLVPLDIQHRDVAIMPLHVLSVRIHRRLRQYAWNGAGVLPRPRSISTRTQTYSYVGHFDLSIRRTPAYYALPVSANLCKAFVANNWALFPTRQMVQKLYDFHATHRDDMEQPSPVAEVCCSPSTKNASIAHPRFSH